MDALKAVIMFNGEVIKGLPFHTFKEKLVELGACSEGREWVGDKTVEEFWEQCDRSDWLLWVAGRAKVDVRTLVLCACDIAETATDLLKPDEVLACVWAIDSARRWTLGEADIDEVIEARNAADAAAADADASAARAAYYSADAADAAAYVAYAAAAYSAYSAARAAYSAADAADAASYAAAAADAARAAYYAAASYAARQQSRQNSCAIIRAYITAKDIKKGICL